jgi:hypothetical protein
MAVDADKLEKFVKRRSSELGAGYYSQVFKHPKYEDRIVKFPYYEDLSADLFYQWCRKVRREPWAKHLPKIYGYKTYGPGQFILISEKLTHKCPIENFPLCHMWEDSPEFKGMLAGTVNELLPDCLNNICDFIRSNADMFSDIGENNYMFRPDGTVVFTDPVC